MDKIIDLAKDSKQRLENLEKKSKWTKLCCPNNLNKHIPLCINKSSLQNKHSLTLRTRNRDRIYSLVDEDNKQNQTFDKMFLTHRKINQSEKFLSEERTKESSNSINYNSLFHTLQVDSAHDHLTVSKIHRNNFMSSRDSSNISIESEENRTPENKQSLAENSSTSRRELLSALHTSRKSLGVSLHEVEISKEDTHLQGKQQALLSPSELPKRKRILVKNLIHIGDETCKGIKADHNLFETNKITTNVFVNDNNKTHHKKILKLNQMLCKLSVKKEDLCNNKAVAQSATIKSEAIKPIVLHFSDKNIPNLSHQPERSIINSEFVLPKRSRDKRQIMPVACMIPNTNRSLILKKKRLRVFST